jgi:hypothetical protein
MGLPSPFQPIYVDEAPFSGFATLIYLKRRIGGTDTKV